MTVSEDLVGIVRVEVCLGVIGGKISSALAERNRK